MYEPVIGLEVHIELKTERKMFCACPANWFGKKENSYVCPVCLGLPGALPVPNKEALLWTMRIALAMGCSINADTYFERKHYFYPDLPKGYQISQYHKPLGYNGMFAGIAIERVHLEEDTGKLLYKTNTTGKRYADVDFNRSGVPLVEIVTKPVIRNTQEAIDYLRKLRLLVLYLGVSDVDMEKGSMRCEPNISLRLAGTNKLPPYKVEVKNINSFRFVQKAIEFELQRHESLISVGELPKQETRRYIESSGKTESMRSKEEARDYRYMPEPDIPPIHFTSSEIDTERRELEKIETPEKRYADFISWDISPSASEILVDKKELGDIIRALKQKGTQNSLLQKAANMLINDKDAQKKSIEEIARLANELGAVKAVDSTLLKSSIEKVIVENPKAVADYKNGNVSAINVLVGIVMRELKGKGNAEAVIRELKNRLSF